MEFVTEDHDFDVAELYLNFKTHFPVIVKVTEGFCGNIEDTFGKGEILLIAAIFKQTRAVAKMNMHGRCRVLSIPATYPERLCVLRRGKKATKPSSLSTILVKHELPLTVQFPPDHILTARNKSVNTSHIPPIELVDTLEETCLLGNFITDGSIGEEVIQIPLCLSQLRLSPVTGIKRLSDREWNEFHERLVKESRHIAYDLRVANQHIAEYDNDITKSGVYLTETTPVIHENIVDILEILPNVEMRKHPKSRRRTTSVPTASHVSVHRLVQEWTRKITSILKTNDTKQNRHSSPANLYSGRSDRDVQLEADVDNGDSVILYSRSKPVSVNSKDEIAPVEKKQTNNEAERIIQNVDSSTSKLKCTTIEDDLKRLGKLSTDRYVKSLKFRQHKIGRKLPEESDENVLIDDCQNNIPYHESLEGKLQDTSTQSNDLEKSVHKNGTMSDSSNRHRYENDDIHETTPKLVASEQSQKNRNMIKHAMVEEWLEKMPQPKFKTDSMQPDKSTLESQSEQYTTTTAPTWPISPKSLLQFKRQATTPCTTKSPNPLPMYNNLNAYLHTPISPKSLANHNNRVLNHSPPTTSLSKFYI